MVIRNQAKITQVSQDGRITGEVTLMSEGAIHVVIQSHESLRTYDLQVKSNGRGAFTIMCREMKDNKSMEF